MGRCRSMPGTQYHSDPPNALCKHLANQVNGNSGRCRLGSSGLDLRATSNSPQTPYSRRFAQFGYPHGLGDGAKYVKVEHGDCCAEECAAGPLKAAPNGKAGIPKLKRGDHVWAQIQFPLYFPKGRSCTASELRGRHVEHASSRGKLPSTTTLPRARVPRSRHILPQRPSPRRAAHQQSHTRPRKAF